MTQESKEPILVREEPEGAAWICPRCAYPLDRVSEGNTLDLWECAQCGYLKVVKGERQ